MDDLSDSAIASPYEKPVSFKDEVHLFSPRESPAKCEYCVDIEFIETSIGFKLSNCSQNEFLFSIHTADNCVNLSHMNKRFDSGRVLMSSQRFYSW